MSELNLAITGLSSSDPVPGSYIEVAFAQGEVAGGGSTPRVLFIGPKTSAGSATPGTIVYPLGSVQDAITYFGTGSPIHRGMARFTEVCKSALCYGIAPTESAGVLASGGVTFTTTAAAAGVLTYTCAGETIQVAIAKATTVTAAATALKTEINLQTHWPVIATSTANVCHTKARIKGTDGNAIRHRVLMTGSGVGMTVAASAATLAGGATAEVYTTVATTIEPDKYDYIVPCLNVMAATSARASALRVQIASQALPLVGIRQQMIVCAGTTQATSVSFAAASTNGLANHARVQCLWQENPEWQPFEIAAQFAGVRYNYEVSNPVKNYDGYGKRGTDLWNVPKQYANADWPTRSEVSAAISGGLTPIAVVGGTKTYVVRSCTCSTDVRVRDTSKVTTADRFAQDLGARHESQWTDATVQDDPANDNTQVAPGACTPNRLRDLTIKPLYIRYADAGWLDSNKTLDATTGDIVAVQTGIDPVNGNRINARIPLHVTPLLHQFAAFVSENSSS